MRNIGFAFTFLIGATLYACEAEPVPKTIGCGEGTVLNAASTHCVVSEAALSQSFQEGVDSVDITTDNQVSYDEGFAAGEASVDITTDNLASFDEGFSAGVVSVDITTDNQASYDEGFSAGVASVDITTDNQVSFDEGFSAGVVSVDITTDNQASYDEGFAAGVISVDITTDNQAPYDEGYEAGAASVDITTDNQASFDEGFAAGVASVDITTDNPGCDWSTQHWNGVFCAATEYEISLGGTNLSNAVLKYAQLGGVDLIGADLTNVNFQYSDLSDANLTGAVMWHVFAAPLSGDCPAALPTSWVCVIRSDDSRVLVGPGANLYAVDLSGVDLSGLDLSQANLGNANLSGADLSGTSLVDAHLPNADLTDAIVTNTDFTGANLTGSIQTGANMEEAVFCSVDSHCADDDICTADSCISASCQQLAIAGCCTEDVHCDDGLNCTEDICFEDQCQTTDIVTGCCSTGDCEAVFNIPETSLLLPENQSGQGFHYSDVQASFPEVDWSTLDRLYIPAGHYKYLGISNLPDRSPDHPLVITNKGGQVWVGALEFYSLFGLSGGSNWILTGRWDPVGQTGHHAFPGHDGNNYAHTAGKYGIMVDDQFVGNGPTNLAVSGLSIRGGATDFEVEFVEIARVGFAGLVLKTDDEGDAIMENVKIHDLYVHDTGSECFYIGSTQTQPQHKIMGIEIYNNRLLRSGTELIQVGQVGGGSEIHHNVFMLGALDWKDPFQPWQDNATQLGPREGSVSVHHNIVIGGGELMVNMHPLEAEGDVYQEGDLVHYHDNYFSNGRNAVGVYIGTFANGMTTYRFEDNTFREMVFSYDEISPGKLPPQNFFGVSGPQTNPVELFNNTWDGDSQLVQPKPNIVTSGNVNTTSDPVMFMDAGFPADFDYFLVEIWTDLAGANANAPVYYKEGDHVLWKSDLYRCIEPGEHTDKLPPDHPETWELLPPLPDDVRLHPDSPYQGYGLLDTP